MGDEIRIITRPTVHMVARPLFRPLQFDEHLAAIGADGFDPFDDSREGDAQALVEAGGRTCYQSWSGGRPHADHVRHLVDVNHWSVLEHAQFTFLVAGVSRNLSHELVRHRHLSFSQLSQRYCDQLGHGLGFVVPPAYLPAVECYRDALTGEHPHYEVGLQWVRSCESAARTYRNLVDLDEQVVGKGHRKQVREAARSVLPGCVETRLQVSGNLRAWLEYALKRCHPAADCEHRRFSCRVYDLLEPEAPDVFGAFEKVLLPDGTFEVRRA